MEQEYLKEILNTLKKNNFWTACGAWFGFASLLVALIAVYIALK